MESLSQIALFANRPVPMSPHADIHAVSLPARTYTGDFWFTHRYEDRLWFAVGDVAGKGINAAVFMAMIQEELEHRITSCAATRCDPSTTMQRLHAFLKPLLPGNRFATVVLGHLRDDGWLTIANAGHCPPLIVRADGSIDAIDSTGPAAGILPSPRWRTTTTLLGRAESLVLYSDGVIESRRRDGEELGVHGVRNALRGFHASARETASRVLGAVEEKEDDVTLVVIRRT
ncbi:MAG TPA: PP2C family protein-serine/threonine phosphatase, partial [Thermoanaerobaculia bacterium]|jgi:sigma-B regulation protein RsbU (phosphoserine phosphatase)